MLYEIQLSNKEIKKQPVGDELLEISWSQINLKNN